VVGPGALMRLSFKARVFRTGTTVQMAMRNTDRGADVQAPWQTIEAGNATGLIEGNTLSINVSIGTQTIDGFTIFPNPFTPNGDGINDEIEIRFTIFNITASRKVQVRIYALDGYPVWGTNPIVDAGRVKIRWSGMDRNGNKVPPGLYICKVELDTDVKDAGSTVLPRLISLVY